MHFTMHHPMYGAGLAARGYSKLEELYCAFGVTVYRGKRQDTNEPVILKTRATNATVNANSIEGEYELLTRLCSTGATVEPLTWFHLDSYDCIVMKEDASEGFLLGLEYALKQAPLPLVDFFHLALALSASLGRIHSRHIIHADVKPANFLYSPTKHLARFFDFDLAFPFNDAPCAGSSYPRGTFPYIAPESTGRVGTLPDHRADLYSLGATLYELLTGAPPFSQLSSLSELLHAVMTQPPPSVSVACPSVPSVLAAIISKLLCKDPEQRYQSCLGLYRDLKRCQDALDVQGGDTASFELGSQDITILLQQPWHLYGREKELQVATQFFDQLSTRRVCALFVAGEPGSGKSSFIRHFSSILDDRVLSGQGKFALLHRQSPYKALMSALSSILRCILELEAATRATYVARMKAPLLACIGLLSPLLPELKLLLGDCLATSSCDDVQELPIYALQTLISDSLLKLWADPNTLLLLKNLLIGLADTDNKASLLFVGAYRTNDEGTGAVHDFVKHLQHASVAVEQLELQVLSQRDAQTMLSDMMPSSTLELQALTEVVLKKTLGNPFFALHFLQGIYQDGFVRFDFDREQWVYDLAAIEATSFTDNVAGYLSQRLSLCTDQQRTFIATAACFGVEVPQQLLMGVLEWPIDVLQMTVGFFIERGWFTRANTSLYFSHDHLLGAAYALFAEAERKSCHLRIARLVHARAHDPPMDEELFTVTQHFNRAADAVSGVEERFLVASLNFMGSTRARERASYTTAYELACAAFCIIEQQSDWWHGSRRTLCFTASLALFECQCDLGRDSEANSMFEFLLNRAEQDEERVAALSMRATQLELQSKWCESIAVRVDCVNQLGLHLPLSPTESDVQETVRSAVETFCKKKALILSLPIMATTRSLHVQSELAKLITATLHVAPLLLAACNAELVRLSLNSGALVPAFGAGLIGLASALISMEQFDVAIEMSRSAQEYSKRLTSPFWRCKIYLHLLGLTNWLHTPFTEMQHFQKQASRLAVEAGDTVAVCFLDLIGVLIEFCVGLSLPQIEAHCSAILKRLVQMPVLKNVAILRQCAYNLMTSEDAAPALQGDPSSYDTTTGGLYWAARVMQMHLLERHVDAYAAAQHVKQCLSFVKGLFWIYWYYLHYALTLCALLSSASAAQRETFLSDICDCMRKLERLSGKAPFNFQAVYLLVKAEYTRVQQGGSPRDTIVASIRLYDEAIQKAREQGQPMLIGLASELTGAFYLSLGATSTAQGHLCVAYKSYVEWGAIAKAKALVRRMPFVDAQEIPAKNTSCSFSSADGGSLHARVDVESVVKASQVLTAELSLSNVLELVMNIIMENCAAERGFILLRQLVLDDPQLCISARRYVTTTELNDDSMSQVAIDSVVKSRSILVAGNATADPRFTFDKYVQQKRLRSLICIPIQKDKLLGVVYLENNSFEGAFLPARIPILLAIIFQLAITIENASMLHRIMEYSKELERKNAELRRLDQLKDEFLAITTHELRTPLNAILGSTSLLNDTLLSDDQRDNLQTIESSAATQLHLVNDLLDASKIHAGKLRMTEAPLDLRECVEAALQMVSSAAAEKQLELGYLVKCPLPERLILGDCGRLKQIMLNLLSNAVKFTDKGEVQLVVLSCHVTSADEVQLCFEVRDTGIGIPPSKLGELFSLFSQLDNSSTRSYDGSGLGLYLTDKLVKLMNGTISVSSDGVHGSTFRVELHLRLSSSASPPREFPPCLAALTGKRVLMLAASSINVAVFEQLLPTVKATTIPLLVERHDSRLELPGSVTFEYLESVDIVVAELALIPQLLLVARARSNPQRPLFVALANPLQWANFQHDKQDLVPLFKPLSHASLLLVLAKAYEQLLKRCTVAVAAATTTITTIATSTVATIPIPAKARILVVEDNKLNSKVLQRIVTSANYIAHCAANGFEAIEAMKRQPYDLVLMDLFMPLMDGFECTRQLRCLGFKCPIIAVSATPNEEACWEAGITDILPKPVTKASVIRVLERVLIQQ